MALLDSKSVDGEPQRKSVTSARTRTSLRSTSSVKLQPHKPKRKTVQSKVPQAPAEPSIGSSTSTSHSIHKTPKSLHLPPKPSAASSTSSAKVSIASSISTFLPPPPDDVPEATSAARVSAISALRPSLAGDRASVAHADASSERVADAPLENCSVPEPTLDARYQVDRISIIPASGPRARVGSDGLSDRAQCVTRGTTPSPRAKNEKRKERASRVQARFPLNANVEILEPMTLYDGEHRTSDELCDLRAGQRCTVVDHGDRDRLKVSLHDGLGQLTGWVCCSTSSGCPSIAIVEANTKGQQQRRSSARRNGPRRLSGRKSKNDCAREGDIAAREFTNGGFPIGSQIKALRSLMVRVAESVTSEEIGEMPEGVVGTVVEHGSDKTGKRLKIALLGFGIRGWISCSTKSGSPLIAVVNPEEQTEETAGMRRDTYEIGATLRLLRSTTMRVNEDFDSEEICDVPANQQCVVVQLDSHKINQQLKIRLEELNLEGWISLSVKPLPEVVEISTPEPEEYVPVVGDTTTTATTSDCLQVAVAAAVPNHAFAIGCEVRLLKDIMLREGEELTSSEVCEMQAGWRCFVRGHGRGDSSKRLFVRFPAGVEGWLSCRAQSGMPLIELVEKREQGKHRTSSSTSSSSSSSGTTSCFKPTWQDMQLPPSDVLLRNFKTPHQTEEVRIDPTDGNALTFGGFMQKYGSQRRCTEACELWELAIRATVDGLPMRPGKRLCKAYAATGGCKFGVQCRYDHSMLPENSNESRGSAERSRSVPSQRPNGGDAGAGAGLIQKSRRRIIHRICLKNAQHPGWTLSVMPADRVYLQEVRPDSWAYSQGLEDGDELIDIGGLGPGSFSEDHFHETMKRRPLWLTFACERERGEDIGRNNARPKAAPLDQRARSVDPKNKETAISSLFKGLTKGIGAGLTLAKDSSQKSLANLRKGANDRYQDGKDNLVQQLGVAVAKEDSSGINKLLDGVMGECLFGKNSPDIVTRAAHTVASRQLRDCLNSGDPKVIKGALVAAKRLNAVDVPEFKLAVEAYKEVKKFPPNWDLGKMLSNRKEGKMVTKSKVQDPIVVQKFQRLLDSTHRKIYTRDRNGDDVPERLLIHSVVEVANDGLWVDYMARQEEIRREICSAEATAQFSVIATDSGTALAQFEAEVSSEDGKADCLIEPPLDSAVNEVLLFHGTNPVASEQITTDNFRISFAGSNAGTLYGRGVYMAENASKSDEYTQMDDKTGLRTLLACRVTLGCAFQTEAVLPDPRACEESCLHGIFHAVIGDRRKCRGTYREFVVFDEEQVYANYIITYRRSMIPPKRDKIK